MDDKTLLQIGARFSRRHQFDAAQVSAFAALAGDSNPLHHDAAFARASPYADLIVSGTQTTALMLGLAAAHFSTFRSVVGVSFAIEFKRAVLADALVELRWEIAGVRLEGKASRVELVGGVFSEEGSLAVRTEGVISVLSVRSDT